MPRSDTGTDWPTAEHEDQTFLADVEAVLAASRVLVGVAVRSLAPVENTVTLTQFRALVIMASRGPMHLAALAKAMQVHPSNATRACDRLVASGLANRRDNPADRRHLLLTLTSPGRQLVDGVTDRRRAAIQQILQRMPPAACTPVAAGFARFAAAGGEPEHTDLWSIGWPTESPAVQEVSRSMRPNPST